MARFIVDESLPASLAAELQRIGHNASHVYSLDMRGAPDEDIYERAVSEGAIVISQDLGFADVRRFSGAAGVVVVRMRKRIAINTLVATTIQLLSNFALEVEHLQGKILILEPTRSRIRTL